MKSPDAGDAVPRDTPAPPTPPQRAFETVLDHIEAMILDGRLAVHDRLPPEREMAQQLGVSRPAIREAIRTLEALGVLASHVGSGASAGTHVIDERSHALERLLRLQVALAQFPLDEVVSTRIALERTSCTLAARQADTEGLARLDALVAMMAGVEPRDQFNELDTRFHVMIGQLGGNQLMGDLTEAVRESLRLLILAAEQRLPDWAAFRAARQAEHEQIAAALAAGEGERAADLMEAHIRQSHARLPIELPGQQRP